MPLRLVPGIFTVVHKLYFSFTPLAVLLTSFILFGCSWLKTIIATSSFPTWDHGHLARIMLDNQRGGARELS
ncbi:MAG: hypothetical protein WCK47_10730 [bacterium]